MIKSTILIMLAIFLVMLAIFLVWQIVDLLFKLIRPAVNLPKLPVTWLDMINRLIAAFCLGCLAAYWIMK